MIGIFIDWKRSRTATALCIYEDKQVEINKMPLRTEKEVYAWLGADNAAVNEVREAFYQDTIDRNCHDNCMNVSLSWLRSLVEKG